jgi:hypothetical protein
MQPTASFTFLVTTARAESKAMDSRRGLASKLSPTQTALKAPESSPRFAMSKSSGTVTAPIITPRFAKVSPKVAIDRLSKYECSPAFIAYGVACEMCGREDSPRRREWREFEFASAIFPPSRNVQSVLSTIGKSLACFINIGIKHMPVKSRETTP